MATTRYAFTPEAAHFPSSNFAALTAINNRPVLAYADGSAKLTAYWTFVAPQGLSGALSLYAHIFQSGTSGNNTYWLAAIEAVTPGDSDDLDTGDTLWGSDNTNTAWAPPTTAGYQNTMSITLTNADSIAAGDYCRLRLQRDPTQAGDTNAGTMYVTLVELREA